MAEAVKFKVQGMDSLQKQMRELPVKVRRASARKALRGAASMMNKKIKANTPTETMDKFGIPNRLLKRSIGRRKKTYSRTGVVVEVIGPRNDPKFRVPLAFKKHSGQPMTRVAQFVERGTPDAEAEPFIRPTFVSNKDKAARLIQDNLAKIVVEEALKLKGAAT